MKLGIALLGVSGVGDDAGVLRVLGAHDEFTLYSATAFSNGSDDPDSEIWALATTVDGWGRIACVERLAKTDDPAIRRWILRSGFRNNVMNEYLAWIAATTGGLLEALEGDEVDRELLTAAGEIIEALIAGGPAKDMDDYDEAAAAAVVFVGHLERRAESLGDAAALVAIQRYLTSTTDWDERSTRGWTSTSRSALEQACTRLLTPSRWADRIETALASPDSGESWRASDVARNLGIDVFSQLVRRIERDPIGGPWFDAWADADHERAELLCSLARRLLDPHALASGALDDMGFGPERKAHMAFEWTLQGLRNYPGVGQDLLLAGLLQPGIRSRNMALAAFQHWTPSLWTADTSGAIRAVVEGDPVEQVRIYAAEVLNGRPPEIWT